MLDPDLLSCIHGIYYRSPCKECANVHTFKLDPTYPQVEALKAELTSANAEEVERLNKWADDATVILNKTREMVKANDLMVRSGQKPSSFSAALIRAIDVILANR